MTLLETRVEQCVFAKQAVKGTPATAPATRAAGVKGRKVAGGFNVNRTDAGENYSDGTRFGDSRDFVSTLIGDINPAVQGQPDVIAYLAYLISGQETVTGAADPWSHVATPATNGAFWFTSWKKVGASVGPLRQKFNDCRPTSLQLQASQDQKVLRATFSALSLDPGEIFVTDPTVADGGVVPMLYTEGAGTITIDGTVYNCVSGWDITINDAPTPAYGDDVVPCDVGFGTSAVTINSVVMNLDQAGLNRFYTQIYGKTTPVTADKPVKVVPALGSFSADLVRSTNREVKIEIPGVNWAPELTIEGNPDGGVATITLTGAGRLSGGNPMYRITTKTDIAAFT